ncbi:MAG: BamA/TamA family outer membrane protein [Bacteroidota bacterium]
MILFISESTEKSFSQLKLVIVNADDVTKKVVDDLRHFKWPDTVSDSATAIGFCNKLIPELYSKGYLAATIDSVYIKDSSFNVLLYTGAIYQWATITSHLDRGVINESGTANLLLKRKTVTPLSVSVIVKKMLKWYSDNGYPFAKVSFDSIVIDGSSVNGVLKAEKGEQVYFDSLVIKGNSRLAYSYLINYLGLRKDDIYNETKLERISARLKEIPFITEVRKKESEFSGNKVRIIIYIDDRKASQFSGIIGVLPDNSNGGKVKVTGDVKLRLLNSFNHAELFDLNWSNPLPKSQDLKVKLNYPFLFDLPFGLDVGLNLFKKDSTFLEFERQVGIQHFLQGSNYIKVYVSLLTSDLISVKGYENAITLPEYADVRTTTYGIGWRFSKLDYRLNPRRGFNVEAQAGVGTKIISRNSRLKPELYDSVDLHTNHYNGNGNADIYIPVMARGVVNAGVMGAWLFSPDIFTNELFRFGGLKTLRGFNELSINASRYIIGKLEYRYILEQNSYLFVFGNMAYYEDRSRNKFIHDAPYGYGAGITFETKLGIFSFTYALGKQFDNPVLIKDGKVHFGLVNYF